MTTVQSISDYDKLHPTAITIGTFDGVHLGHRKILERLIQSRQGTDLKATVLTFFPHPRMVLQKDSGIQLLNTLPEKEQILESMDIDYLIVHPFTKEFSRLTAEQFVRDQLVHNLRAKKIVIGHDHRFGRNRNADITDLRAFGNALDFEVEEIPAQEIDEVSISSTKIRRALEEGDIETANAYLGYSYMLTGSVVKGKGLGKSFGFPTANLHVPEAYKLIPKTGAYIVQSNIDGKTVYGMMNIGYNPTFSGTDKRIEVHFLDLNEDLYGREIQVNLLHRLRDERKFATVEHLKEQLAMDKKETLLFLSR